MRAIAMKLHTKEQAPKEGGVAAPKRNKPVCYSFGQQACANGVDPAVWQPLASRSICCLLQHT